MVQCICCEPTLNVIANSSLVSRVRRKCKLYNFKPFFVRAFDYFC